MAAFPIESPSRPPRPKRWTKAEYNRLVELGAFQGQRVYLFRGELIEMSPQLHPHGHAVTRLNTILFRMFGVDAGYEVRIQCPFDTPGDTVAEPDGLVCTTEQFKHKPHPNRAELVIEIADSSLAIDRKKALEYAAAQVPEYWIVDVNARRLEVYRSIAPDPTTVLGFRYADVRFVDEDETISPVAKSDASFSVGSVLHSVE